MKLNKTSQGQYAEIDALTREEWEDQLQSFNDASIYQTWAYGAVRWGEKNLSHLTIKKNSEVIAVAQLRIIRLPLLGSGIAYLPWGPVWKRRDHETEPEIFHSAIKALKEEYALKRGLLLRIRPCITEDKREQINPCLNQEGFKKNLAEPPYRTLVADLSLPMSEIRKALDQKWRNQLNRSEKNNLKIIEGYGDDLYQIFLGLQKEMFERKKYSTSVDYDEFREIQKALPQSLKMIILICECDGKVLTATIGSKIGNTGIYLLGATGNEGMKMKSAYLSQWRMMEILKESGCRWYDLGGIDPDHNPGVYHFKSGISRNDVYHIGQYDFSSSTMSSMIVKGAEGLKAFQEKMKR